MIKHVEIKANGMPRSRRRNDSITKTRKDDIVTCIKCCEEQEEACNTCTVVQSYSSLNK